MTHTKVSLGIFALQICVLISLLYVFPSYGICDPPFRGRDTTIVSNSGVYPFSSSASPFIAGLRSRFENFVVVSDSDPLPYVFEMGVNLFRNERLSEYMDYGVRYGNCTFFPTRLQLESYESQEFVWQELVQGVWVTMIGHYFAGVRNSSFAWRWYGWNSLETGVYIEPAPGLTPVIVEWAFPSPRYLPASSEDMWYNMYEASGFSFHVQRPAWVDSVGPLPVMDSLKLLNQNVWAEWLPTANIDQADPEYSPLEMRFKFFCGDAPSMEWDMRVKLFDISHYPGYSTNYRGVEFDTSRHELIGRDWVDIAGACEYADSMKADMRLRLDEQITPNLWEISWNYEMDAEDHLLGYFLADYVNTIENGDIFTIVISPDDFAARAKLSVEIAPHGRDLWFPLIERYLTDKSGDKELVTYYTIPRDDEITIEKVRNKGQTIRYVSSIGDRLADVWEEQYVANSQSHNDSAMYTNIYQCKPFQDDSDKDKSFYPVNTDQRVKEAGDGILNFEKYRGIYGIHDIDNDLVHRRLPPSFRNILVVPIVAEEDNPIPEEYGRTNITTYFSAIEESSSVKIYQLEKNQNTNNNFENWLIYSFPTDSINGLDREYQGQKRLDYTILDYMVPENSEIHAIYCIQYNEVNEILERILAQARSEQEEDVVNLGIALPDTTKPERCPQYTYGSYTFMSKMKIIPNITKEKIRQVQAFVFGHELGHFVGMEHPPQTELNSIMDEILDTSDTVPSYYRKRDFKDFRLKKCLTN